MKHVKTGTAAILALAAGGFFLWGAYNRAQVENFVAETGTSIVISRSDFFGGKTIYSTYLDTNMAFRDTVDVSDGISQMHLEDGGIAGKRDGLVDRLYDSRVGEAELRRENDYQQNKDAFDRADERLLKVKKRFREELFDWQVREQMIKGRFEFDKLYKGHH